MRHLNKPLPLITLTMVGVFLAANAQMLLVAGWAIAFSYTMWHLMTREGGPGAPLALCRILLWPLFLLLTGLHGLLDHPLSSVGKDCWYFMTPITYIAFGYFAMERVKSFEHVVYVFSAVGVFTSLQSLWNIYEHTSALLSASSAESYRHVVGIGSGQAMIPVVLIVMCRKKNIALGILDEYRWLRYFIIVTGSLSIALALSRVLLLILVLGVVAGAGRKVLVYGLIAAGIGVIALHTSSIFESAASQSFVDKFSRIGEEVQLRPYSTMADINDNWRGFEGYKALETYQGLNPVEQLFGGGFGQMVDLGFTMNLGGPTEVQEIPVLHNGYLYLLVKTGLVGVTLFLLFVGQVLARGRKLLKTRTEGAQFYGLMLLWSGITFLLTQGVITGIYNKGVLAPNLVLLGIAIAGCGLKERTGVRVATGPAFAPQGVRPGQYGVPSAMLGVEAWNLS